MPDAKSESMGLLKALADDIAVEDDPQKAQAKTARLIIEMDGFRRIEHDKVLEKIEDNKKDASNEIGAVATGVAGILVSLNGNGQPEKGLNYKVAKNSDAINGIKKWFYVAGVATLLWILNSIFGLIAI